MPLTKNAKHHKNSNVNDPLSLYYDNSTEIAINNNILLVFCRSFQVGPLSGSFRLEVNGYSGTAGLF